MEWRERGQVIGRSRAEAPRIHALTDGLCHPPALALTAVHAAAEAVLEEDACEVADEFS